ncbi:hypothetical protein EDC14_100470 [Hydrogenispora ethanolica]|uniref:Uncharacterized protein n=1 Tax=Hydrogenispora ethanolica TaxID=1082276 RepID=A0A4R1S548_HYDET|nr:hypothetical protein [Hydrogenispora ethanolica]TCL74134.1 hypothetical protein EDC14_100470 [Hydrogenispora ethanolica]
MVPDGLTMALFIGCIALEDDRMLRRELAGYSDYAQRVKYRLLPAI